MTMWRITRICFIAACMVAVVAGPSAAQDCVRLDTDPPRATLTLKLTSFESKVAPATYCSLQPGVTYRLTISNKNYETRTLKLVVLADGSARYKGVRTSHLLRSLILPGWGQASMGQVGRTIMTVTNLLATGVSTWRRYEDWNNEETNRDLYVHLLDIAQSPSVQQTLEERAELAARNADAYEEAFLVSAAWTGWWYLANLFDTGYLASPPKVMKGDDGVTTLRTPHRSKSRAVMQSVLWPGMGQLYKGKVTRGVLFQWGTIISGLIAIDKKLLYDLREIDYEMTLAAADTASDATEEALLLTLAEIKKSDVDKLENQFYIWAGTTVGLWLINIIDAALGGNAPDYPGRFETDLSWRSGTLYTGFKVQIP